MTPRQARRERRETQRKAARLAYKAAKAAEKRIGFVSQNDTVPPTDAMHVPDHHDDHLDPHATLERAPSSSTGAQEHDVAQKEKALNAADSRFVSQSELVSRNAPEPSRRAQTNRENAQLSTGPRTTTGKMASSRNSLKHGLASGQPIIPGEDPAEFDALFQQLCAEHQPVSATEQLFIKEMAQSYWLTQRAIRFQNECFTAEALDEKRLALFLRYQTTHQRAFYKAFTTLIRLQKDRARAPSGTQKIGFVSQNIAAQAEMTAPAAETIGFVSQTDIQHRDPNRPTCTERGGREFVRQNTAPHIPHGGAQAA